MYAALALIAAIYIGIQSALPHTTFFSNDGGEKLVQVKALIDHDTFDPSLPYDQLGVEPKGSFRFAPFIPMYAFKHEGKLYSIVPFYFPLASSFAFSAFGYAGLFIMPLLGAFLTTCLVAWICARTLGYASALLAAVTIGLASSVFFYGLTFWEHTVSMFLAMAALALFYGGRGDTTRFSPRIYAAGVLLALGAWMRTDVHFLSAGLALAMLIQRGRRRHLVALGAGLLTGLLPFFILNQIVYGSPSGPQIVTGVTSLSTPGGFGDMLAARWSVTKYILFTYANLSWLDYLFFFVAVCPAIYFSRIRKWSRRHESDLLLWIALIVLTVLVTLCLLLSIARLMPATVTVLGLFVALPVLPFAIARPRAAKPRDDDDFYATLAITLSIALVITCLALADSGGLQWGPRYALVLFPPLVLLAVRGIADLHGKLTSESRRRSLRILVVLLLACGVSVQGLGISLLRSKKLATVRNNEVIRAAKPPVIITPTWWFPMDSGDLVAEIPLYEIHRGKDVPDLLDGIYQAGIDQALLVSSVDLQEDIAASHRMKLVTFKRTHHPRTPKFDLFLFRVQLTGPPGRR